MCRVATVRQCDEGDAAPLLRTLLGAGRTGPLERAGRRPVIQSAAGADTTQTRAQVSKLSERLATSMEAMFNKDIGSARELSIEEWRRRSAGDKL